MEIVPKYISEAAIKKKRKKKKSDATDWKKNENTNLIVTSAACSGEAAGCQTLKGTGAEFNASCQGSLMWLSPPARAGIVKLSGAGWGRSNSAAGCPLTIPTPGASLRTQQGVGKHPPSSPKSRCVGYMWLRTCAHVWIHGVLTFFCRFPLLLLQML